jgi:transcriptional regulator GlxA family with amidase domain
LAWKITFQGTEERKMSASSGRARLGGTIPGKKALSKEDLIQCPVINPGSLIHVVRERRVRRVLERIEAGPPRSVSELARGVHLSPAHLQRLFKQETGVHISDLLVESRLRNAAHLLSTTEMEVKEIAYLAGYQHHSSFVRAFQRRFHQSPKQYRRPSAA